MLGLDLAVVVVFVVVGRRTHDEAETVAGILETAAPFLAGMATGWVATRASARPIELGTGAGVLLATLVVGMAARALVFSDGTAGTFIAVAAAFLTLGFLGWRLLVLAVVVRAAADLEA